MEYELEKDGKRKVYEISYSQIMERKLLKNQQILTILMSVAVIMLFVIIAIFLFYGLHLLEWLNFYNIPTRVLEVLS